MNCKRKSRRRFFLLMRSRTPPISSEFRVGGVEHPKPPLGAPLRQHRQTDLDGSYSHRAVLAWLQLALHKSLQSPPLCSQDWITKKREFWVCKIRLIKMKLQGRTEVEDGWHEGTWTDGNGNNRVLGESCVVGLVTNSLHSALNIDKVAARCRWTAVNVTL